MSLVRDFREAWARHEHDARAAYPRFRAMLAWPLPARPGMDTHASLALRMFYGKTADEAVAREYLYRWGLALSSPIFGVPHTLGM